MHVELDGDCGGVEAEFCCVLEAGHRGVHFDGEMHSTESVKWKELTRQAKQGDEDDAEPPTV